MCKDLFTPNPLDPNVYDITLKEKVHEDGYFSLELNDNKVWFRGIMQITLLSEKDQVFRKGLEQFISNEEEADKLATKYIHAYNKACSQHLTPFLHEPNYTVEGDGEPEWIVFYKKDLTKEFANCQKNRDAIMVISETVDRAGFHLVFKEMKQNYFGARSQMLKEAKENYIFAKQELLAKDKSQQPINTAENVPSTPSQTKIKPLQIKIFSDLDKKALEGQVNQWLSENTNVEINGLEFNTCPFENKVEGNIFIVYK